MGRPLVKARLLQTVAETLRIPGLLDAALEPPETALGVLMNTRGLMELIVLNIGLDLSVLSPKLFAMLVIMAVVTTLMTSPLLHMLTRGEGALVAADSHSASSLGGRAD